jgi:hypothetical protein
MKTAFVGNTNLLELSDTTDEITDTFINDATVVATVVDEDGVEVGGETWPLSMPYVTGSDGLYRGALDPGIEFIAGECYIARITATDGGSVGYWEFHFTPITRS